MTEVVSVGFLLLLFLHFLDPLKLSYPVVELYDYIIVLDSGVQGLRLKFFFGRRRQSSFNLLSLGLMLVLILLITGLAIREVLINKPLLLKDHVSGVVPQYDP